MDRPPMNDSLVGFFLFIQINLPLPGWRGSRKPIVNAAKRAGLQE